eukprot:1408388-Prymnesium_polylepis.1
MHQAHRACASPGAPAMCGGTSAAKTATCSPPIGEKTAGATRTPLPSVSDGVQPYTCATIASAAAVAALRTAAVSPPATPLRRPRVPPAVGSRYSMR